MGASSGYGSASLLSNANSMHAASATDILPSSQRGAMSVDSSFKRALMGLSMGSFPNHSLHASDHMSCFDNNGSMSTSASAAPNYNSLPFCGTPSSSSATAAVDNSGNNIDRRRVFAKMKYTRPPSVRSPKAAPTGSLSAGVAQQQHGVASQYTFEEIPDFHLLDSSMSI